MDLDEVRRKLTAGYERINNMKHSITKVETCRAKLKAKQENILEEIGTMMNQMTEKLLSLQQVIEVTVKEKVAEKESLLDAKKKEIHDGYARLVQVCVEADKVLRGRNDDLLGRSCQRLFNNFETAKVKLDTAERVDTQEITAFEFHNNMQQFLSSTFVAKLQHMDRSWQPKEIEEFWADTPWYQTDLPLNTGSAVNSFCSVSNHVDTSTNNRYTASHKSPGRISVESPRHALETIQQVPEDSSPRREQKFSTKHESNAGVELDVVHIHEAELCVRRNIDTYSYTSNAKKSNKTISSFVRPPPGFSHLDKRMYYPDVHMQPVSRSRLKPQSSPDMSPDSSSPTCTPDHAVDCWPADSPDEISSGVSNPEISPSSSDLGTNSSRTSLKSTRSHSSPVQSLKTVAAKAAVRSRDEEDFVWDSDDSAEIPSTDQEFGRYSSTCRSGASESAAKSKFYSASNKKDPDVKMCRSCRPVGISGPKEESCKPLSGLRQISDTIKPAGNSGKAAGWSPKSDSNNTNTATFETSTFKNETLDTVSGCSPSVKGHCKTGAVTALDHESSDQHQHSAEENYGNKAIDDKDLKKEETKCTENTKEEREEKANEKDKKAEVKRQINFGSVQDKSDKIKREIEEAAGPKVAEVSRPVKTRSKRVDLGQMLEHVGGSSYEISAKCIEKIRGDFDHPIGVCTNSKGDVIIADTSNNIIKVFNNGRVTKKLGTDLKMRRPSAVVANEKDELFVKDDHCLYHFDAEGQFIKAIGKRMMNAPYGLGMTKEGKLVVVDALYSNGRLHIFEQNGAIDTFPYQPLRSRYDDSKCRFLAVHGETVLTSDLGRSCLYLTNMRGELTKIVGRRGKQLGELYEPAGVAADSMGNWIVADSKNHRVQVFGHNGNFMATLQFAGETIRRPSGIHLTTDGLLYIINYWDSVIKVFKLGAS